MKCKYCKNEGINKIATGAGIEHLCVECYKKVEGWKISHNIKIEKIIDELKKDADKAGQYAILEITSLNDVDLLWNYIGCLSGIPLENELDKEYYIKVTDELIRRKFLNKVRNLFDGLNKKVTVEEFKQYVEMHPESKELTFYQYKLEVLKARETLIENPDILNELGRIYGNKIVQSKISQ